MGERIDGRRNGGTGERNTRGRRVARDASFLAEASRLLANSLDYETTLSTVAGLALPDLGAWCIVDITEPDGSIRRLAIVHPDPDKQELARELREGWPPQRHDPLGVPVVARDLRPEIIPVVSEELLHRMARDERNLKILRRLRIGSIMSLPLAARGDVLGAMTFISDPARPPYDEEDLSLAEDLANRAAIAIDNARLYRQAQASHASAEMASRAKSQFLGVMSHELRTPINAILGYTQLLDMGVKGPLADDQRQLLSRIEASGRHLLELITRVLDVSKAEAGELSVSNQRNLVHDVVESTLQVATQKAPDGISIHGECDPDGRLSFLGDGIRVRQILVQLLDNAFRFSPDGGVVTLRCDRVEDGHPDAPLGAGPWIRIAVQDEGSGIPADRTAAIFEPFVQADVSEFTRETDGPGLGLAISRYLARLMGGDLRVQSEHGVGSTFTLWLAAPRDRPDPRHERRGFARETRGLPALADHLLRRLKPLTDAYVQRLSQDAAVPRAAEAEEIELRNHVPYFLTGLATLLEHAETAGEDASRVLRGGSTIQRNILELHGAQRQHLGWSPDAVERDLDILRLTIRRDIRITTPEGVDNAALVVLDRLFDQARNISLQGWRHAHNNGPSTEKALPAPQGARGPS